MFFILFVMISIFHPSIISHKIPPPFKVSAKIPNISLQKYLLQRTNTMLYPFSPKKLVGTYGLTRSKILRFGWEFHGKSGNKIRLADGGQVVFSEWIHGYGYSTLVRSDKNFIFFYAGNIRSSLKVGDVVTRGSFFGKLRSDGKWFFAVFCQGWPIDPEYLLHIGDWWNLKKQ